jgi:hypothetical protein
MKVPTGLFEIGSEVPCHLGYPWTVRVRGDPEHVDDSSLEHEHDRDHDHDHDHEHEHGHEHEHEQHVVAPEQHAVDVEEVGCENPLGLGGEELGPRRARSSWSRWQTVPAQDSGDARLRHGDAELCELADDSEITPPWVSLARRQISSTVSSGRAGRPGRRCG